MNGWIKLHRKILEWEWYGDKNTSRLFFHLLLSANYKERKWRGITIKKGEKLTSQDKLAEETGLTRQQVRTSLTKLKSTNDITINAKTQHTVIYIVNWEKYQEIEDDNQQDNQRVTNEQPTDNQRITTNKKEKKENKVKNKDIVDFSCFEITEEQVKEIKRIRKSNKGGEISQRAANGLSKQFILAKKAGYSVEEILTEWDTRGWKSFKAEWLALKQVGTDHEMSNKPLVKEF